MYKITKCKAAAAEGPKGQIQRGFRPLAKAQLLSSDPPRYGLNQEVPHIPTPMQQISHRDGADYICFYFVRHIAVVVDTVSSTTHLIPEMRICSKLSAHTV